MTNPVLKQIDETSGERVLQQFADTAKNILLDVVNPIGDYLESTKKEDAAGMYRSV